MLKWALTVVIGLVILAVATPWLRLPGDFRIPVRGRMYYLPVTSTLLLSLLVWGIGKLL
jgi:hypothetical protein